MKLGKLVAAGAGFGLLLSSVGTQAVAADRVAQPIGNESEMGGATTIAVIFALVAAVAFVLAADSNDDPASP